MTLKKLNPEQLEPGKKYLVELELFEIDDSGWPYSFEDVKGCSLLLPKDQPIYTHEPLEPTAEPTDDRELEMLVSVASRLWAHYTAMFLNDRIPTAPSNIEIACEAIDIINACKNELNKKA